MERLYSKVIRTFEGKITEQIVAEDALKAIGSCIQCGLCSGGCPSGRRTAMRTRQIVRKALLNLTEVLSDEDIWMCTTCYTCYERCPRSVPITDIIIKLRNLATQQGHMLQPHKDLSHILIQTGHGVPLGGETSKWAKMRTSYGLSCQPPTTHTHPEDVAEIVKIVHKTQFDRLVGYETEK